MQATVEEAKDHAERELQVAKDALEDKAREVAEVQRLVEAQEHTITETGTIIDATRKRIEQQRSELEEKQRQHAAMQAEVDKDRAEQAAVEAELNKVNARLSKAKAARRRNDTEVRKAEALAELKRLFKGAYGIVDARAPVWCWRRSRCSSLTPLGCGHPLPGVRGRLIDLCRPVSKRYETAVMRVLGKQAESIVVDTSAASFECMAVRRDRALLCDMLLIALALAHLAACHACSTCARTRSAPPSSCHWTSCGRAL